MCESELFLLVQWLPNHNPKHGSFELNHSMIFYLFRGTLLNSEAIENRSNAMCPSDPLLPYYTHVPYPYSIAIRCAMISKVYSDMFVLFCHFIILFYLPVCRLFDAHRRLSFWSLFQIQL